MGNIIAQYNCFFNKIWGPNHLMERFSPPLTRGHHTFILWRIGSWCRQVKPLLERPYGCYTRRKTCLIDDFPLPTATSASRTGHFGFLGWLLDGVVRF